MFDTELMNTYRNLTYSDRATLAECYRENRHRIGSHDDEGNRYTFDAFLWDVVADSSQIEWSQAMTETAAAFRQDMEICTACPTHCGTDPEPANQIVHVACVTCGHNTSDRHAIESWNQYGDHGTHHDTDVTVWTYANGDRLTIAQTDDGRIRNEYRHDATVTR